MNANLFAKANRIIQSCGEAYLGVLGEDGGPHVSTVSTIAPRDIFTARFATGLGANKTRRLLRDGRASVCYRSGGDNITLDGTAVVLTDQQTKTGCWQDWFIHHFPGGETDPNYCVIAFTAQRASLWIGNESAEFTIGELLTVQSRCGCLCAWCSYRESHGCGGCIETNGHPFHGACPVAQCCQGKGFTHCGQCADLPDACADPDCKRIDANSFFECGGCPNTTCDKLHAYSYKDPDHGDNPPGARVEVCRAWAKA